MVVIAQYLRLSQCRDTVTRYWLRFYTLYPTFAPSLLPPPPTAHTPVAPRIPDYFDSPATVVVSGANAAQLSDWCVLTKVKKAHEGSKVGPTAARATMSASREAAWRSLCGGSGTADSIRSAPVSICALRAC